ncbi:bifunctional 3'-5' exonuclease/ATP-dependent helicase WRN-like [Malaya genurostris]|uniref:bifunctional 3'-5' exonuclease/ATP-dependent helicase WRN-like n=1 Tax=Malaya genurostris TaxID=325434 RepID=UPI0026F3EFF3|nr:bifunctional 3'-5' exonuclease/ATP-dependent helicase WRN-like [Malaya genurostris]
METIKPPTAHLAALESHFGHSNFRPMQWTIIRSIIEDRQDNCVIMATGYGKSLTYQYPSVFLQKLTIVISPLISLMEDQVLSLNLSNIPACLLGSAQRANPIPDIKAGLFRIVYLTPEYVTGDAGKYLLEQVNDQLVLIAIDEAHCLSKWGHDFRPAYRHLGLIRRICPRVPILAVTATATPNVREDIVSSLGLRNPQVLCTGFDRPNLTFHVKMKGTLGVWEDLRTLLSKNTEGSVIIYCLTRKQTEEIVELLKSKNIDCEPYHAGLSLKQRQQVHESFVRDRIQIIVATIAFGMGIDKPDVRLVIHFGASKDLESYYQEAGRAGRDGQPSKCVMFWSRADFKTHEFLREHSQGGVQKNLEALSKKMHEYLDTRDCRRLFILRYFEGNNVKIDPRKQCCDNCDRTVGGVKDSDRYEGIDENGNYDFSKDTEHLLKAIEAFGGGTGVALPIALLRGSKSKKLNDHYLKNPLHGVGKSRDEDWWKALATLLEREGFLNKIKLPNNYNKFAVIYKVQLTPTARKWLETSNRKLPMKPTAEMFKSLRLVRAQPLFDTFVDFQSQPKATFKLLPPPGSSSTSQVLDQSSMPKQDLVQDMVKSLLKKRSELATTYECMPYMIASNQALHQMATARPLNLDEMKRAKLDGFSDIKIQKFGKEFLACIQQKLNLPTKSDGTDGLSTIQQALQHYPLAKGKFSPTHQTTWNLWLEGRSVADIAKFRSLAEATVTSHLCEAIKHGFFFGWKDFSRVDVDRKMFEHIKSTLPPNLDGVKLTDIKNRCLPHVTFDQIKLVLTYVQLRNHLKSHNIQVENDAAAPAAPKMMPVPSADNLWGDEDEDELTVADSSFDEIDRMCEKATNSQKGNEKVPIPGSITIDDDEEDIDLDEIAALEQAVINGDDASFDGAKSSQANAATTKQLSNSRRIIYDDSDDDAEQPPKGPSPRKQAKLEPVVDVAKPTFQFKTASSAAVPCSRLSNRKIIYDDSDDDDEDIAKTEAMPLPRRRIS